MILVTGASGNVGSALLGELRAAGHHVRAAYRSRGQVAQAVQAGHEAVIADLSRPDTLSFPLHGVDTVFLLAASGAEQPGHELGLIEAARAAGVRRVVKLSVWRADERLTPIARWHWPAEEALRSSDLAWTFLRPNFYMQNFTRQMARPIRETGSFAQPETEAAISFVDTRDIARVAARVLTTPGHDGRVYDITGPEALTYEQAAAVLSTVLGTPVRFTGLTDEEARADMLRRGLPPGYADVLIEVSRAYRHGGVEGVTSVVRDLTGRAPVSFEEFVRDNLAVFQG
ncbi:MAG: SDR family oxidoreductase [Trebonia sp.]